MTTAGLEAGASRPAHYRPWLQRAIDASGLPLAVAGVAIATLQLAGFFGWMGLGWALGFGHPSDAWFWQKMVGPNVIMAALIGWAPAAMAWSHRRAAAELAALAPELRAGPFDPLERLATLPRWPLALVGAAFAALIVPIVRFDPSMHAAFVETHGFGRAWMLFVNAEVGWLLVRALLEELRVSQVFYDAGARVAELDLFDLTPLEPFARRAVEAVLLGAVSAGLLTLIFAGEGWASSTLPVLLVGMLLPSLAAFVLPLLGVHRRIRAEKRAELARIHARARADRDALLAGTAPAAEAAARLPALLALRAQVADVREWPLDLPSVVRLAAFLALGLASWVGAALVDAGIEGLLRQ
jgi:hypothetical protein